MALLAYPDEQSTLGWGTVVVEKAYKKFTGDRASTPMSDPERTFCQDGGIERGSSVRWFRAVSIMNSSQAGPGVLPVDIGSR